MAEITIGDIEVVNMIKRRGDTKRISMTILQSDKVTAIDVTGETFVFTVTTIPLPVDNTTKLFDSTAIIVDGVNGKISFPITTADANNSGVFFYDISRIEVNGDISTILEGSYLISQDRGK